MGGPGGGSTSFDKRRRGSASHKNYSHDAQEQQFYQSLGGTHNEVILDDLGFSQRKNQWGPNKLHYDHPMLGDTHQRVSSVKRRAMPNMIPHSRLLKLAQL